ncbi:MAG TPA: hypothetical protein VJC20_04260 [Candidatus Paceibacterota bacterium]
MKTIKSSPGIALLLAVLISSLALSASLGIFALLFDQLAFAGTAHESTAAFFAANAAAECVYFSHYIDKLSFVTTEQVRCNGATISINGDDGGERWFTFDVEYLGGRKSCAQVNIYPGSDAGSNTFIMRGNNVSCASLSGATNVIQRVIETRNVVPL